ncbi:hypothetical protein [Anoxybacteroides tepidamans]|uniref:hypothetical protein n=1 Tax=Anoxybacteroides tepidamans TaxID=265948 RepID=UPI0018DE5C1B|nr:hypothetical protein [Anoxybacillus tepidamans]
MKLLVIGKRAGLSFEEINEFRVKDLFSFTEVYTDLLLEKEKPVRRMATQADIDAFFA